MTQFSSLDNLIKYDLIGQVVKSYHPLWWRADVSSEFDSYGYGYLTVSSFNDFSDTVMRYNK